MKGLVYTIALIVCILFVSLAGAQVTLVPLGTYATGVFDGGAAEIASYDPDTQRVFVVNVNDATIDVLNISNPANPTLAFSIDLSPYGNNANSVAVSKKGIVAVAVQANISTDPGSVVLFDTNGQFLSQVQVGSLPDMLIWHKRTLLVANEGEPSDDYVTDPEGSISIIRVPKKPEQLTQADVSTAGFTQFNGQTLDPSIRIYGPNATVAQDLEPEYIAVSPDGSTAWVTLQENNAIAIVDIDNNLVTSLVGLGFKDFNLTGNGLDAGDNDSGINIANWPVLGMYLPDAIHAFEVQGQTFLITVNEGDAREYTAFDEQTRVASEVLDPIAFPNAATLQTDAEIGRLRMTTANGDTDTDGDYDQIYAFGGRSFSIWDSAGAAVFDSGDDLEQITAAALPADFNSNNDANQSFDTRSDDKGPEPEGVTVAKIFKKQLAFIALERVGGIAIFDVSDPNAPVFESYFNNRDFAGDPDTGTAGDLAPEGVIVIKKNKSPNGKPLLVTANEVSGTTTIFEIQKN